MKYDYGRAADRLLVFDMDGTIADLYNTKDWSHRLDASDATVYRDAAPMVDMTVFTNLLHILRTRGYRVVVLTWLQRTQTLIFTKTYVFKRDSGLTGTASLQMMSS